MSLEPGFPNRLIDRAVALRNLERFVEASGIPETFEATALIHFDCGHVRPMNVRFEPGETFHCVICGPRVVVWLELIEPEEFPAVDSLRDLPETSL